MGVYEFEYNLKPSSLNQWDVWALRAGLEVFGFYCLSFVLNPLLKKVFMEKSVSLFEVMYKHTRFFVLVFFGGCLALLFPFHDLMEHRVYYTSISFFVGMFALTETYISYRRLPFKLLSPARNKTTIYIVTASVVMMCLRAILDVIIFIFCFTGPNNDDAYIFVRLMRVVSGFLFTVSEFWVSKITNDVIATPRKDLTADMKLQLKETKGKLQQLALANYVGGASALVDVANHWIEIQMTQAFVMFLGSTAYIFYGNLFQLSLEKDNDYEIPSTSRATISAGTPGSSSANPEKISESSKIPSVSESYTSSSSV